MRNPKPPAIKSANTPTTKTPVIDSLRSARGVTGNAGEPFGGGGGGAALSEGDRVLDAGMGGGWGATGEPTEPGCGVCEAVPFERIGVRGGTTGETDSPGRTNMSLSNSRASSADEPKSSMKPRRRIEFPSSESTEIGLYRPVDSTKSRGPPSSS